MGGIRGAPRGVGAISVCIGAGRECRYLGARKGIGDIRGHLGLLVGVEAIRWYQGYIGGLAECRYSGARRV